MSPHPDIITIDQWQRKTMATSKKQIKLTSLPALEQAAECLRVLAHAHRLRMIQMLLRDRYSVGELAEACEIPSHMASEHLRLLQRCGFLGAQKEGRHVYYHVVETHLQQIMQCVEARFDKAS